MTNQPTEAVIAGSKGFALALLAPLTERVGTRPRVAADPVQAIALTGGSGLLVFEFQGPRSLDAIRLVVDQAAGLAIVAGVPEGNAEAEEVLRSLGVEPARWDGKPDGVLTAVARRLAARAAPGAATEATPAPPRVSAPGAPPPSRVDELFGDIFLDTSAAEPIGADLEGSAAAAPQPPSAGGAWPTEVPDAEHAADVLRKALRGLGAPIPLVAEVVAGLSPLERAVLGGVPQAMDGEPVRRAAVMRVRVAVALASAPPPGGEVDTGAVSALLAEIDDLLSAVNGLVASAPAEVQPSLEQVRNALVKEAIDFSEAAHQTEPTGAGAPGAPQLPGITTAAERRAARTRVISMESKAEREVGAAAAKRQRMMWVVLAIAVALGGGFNGWRFLRAREVVARAERPTRTGAPVDAFVTSSRVPGAAVVIRSKDGRPFSADELKRMQDEEALRGNSVRAAGPAVVVITPKQAADGSPAPGPGR
jgi:hypothetical protein